MDFVGLDKMSLLDYEDKVSCVLFCKPCNFRCPFCHNGELVLGATKTIPWNEIIDYLKSRKGLLDAVVFTGGEVTLMPDIVKKIKQVKEMGFLIKLDTNGTNPEVIKKLVNENLIDYIAMDIKNSPSHYAETCGKDAVKIDDIKESIDFIKNCGVDYEFRTTLVHEYHGELNIEEFGDFIKGAKRLYLQKFVDREGCIIPGLHEVEEEKANEYLEELMKYVSEVYLRGY